MALLGRDRAKCQQLYFGKPSTFKVWEIRLKNARTASIPNPIMTMGVGIHKSRNTLIIHLDAFIKIYLCGLAFIWDIQTCLELQKITFLHLESVYNVPAWSPGWNLPSKDALTGLTAVTCAPITQFPAVINCATTLCFPGEKFAENVQLDTEKCTSTCDTRRAR